MSIIVDGKAIADDIARALRESEQPTPTLAIISVAPNFATLKYLGIKERYAALIGVHMERTELQADATTDDVLAAIEAAKGADGIVLQLPFPPHIDIARTLEAIPASRDVDVIGREASEAFARGGGAVLPPVVGAIAEIAERHGVSFVGARVTVVGKGRLVGVPAALWASHQGSRVTVVGHGDDLRAAVQDADIVILGAGSPGILTPAIVRQGVAIFDAGTSEDGGKLAGDADLACREVASLITPVPGGIGPVAVAKLFENLYRLSQMA